MRIRDDKNPEDATTSEQVRRLVYRAANCLSNLSQFNLKVAEMYERQALATSQATKKARSGVEDNFW